MVRIPAGVAIFLLRNAHRHLFIIGSTALVWPWPPQANFASDLYPAHQPANFYKPISLRLPLPRQSTASVVWWLACWPLVPEFAGSIPTEAVGFFPM
jgi:hypothetical protein